MYADVVALLNFAVDFLLLLAANRLAGYPPRYGRAALAALLGAVYARLCLLPRFDFLGGGLWWAVWLALLSLIAFGCNISTLRRGVLFVLLHMALSGSAYMMNTGGFTGILACAVCLCILCAAGFRERPGARFVQVCLHYGGQTLHITALRDTGNTLCDPVTGESVLVIGADAAKKLIGLNEQQLKNPIEALDCLPGLRLIPYRTVGQSTGLLLGLKLKNVKVGRQSASRLVAFAPEALSTTGEYQALTGGAI